MTQLPKPPLYGSHDPVKVRAAGRRDPGADGRGHDVLVRCTASTMC